jgi:hypothetical protein
MVGRTMAHSQSQAVRHEYEEIVVFTGDLVGSSKLAPQELAEAMRALELASADVVRVWGTSAPGQGARFSSFRGDGWQCLGPGARHALRGALILRARLGMLGRAFDTRVSVGIGAGWLAEEPGLSLASGPAFELSGQALDGLKHARRFAIAWQRPEACAAAVQAIFALADEVSRNWTPGQARVFDELLIERDRPNQEALARTLGITQQSIAEHLAGGGDWALQEALKALEGTA